MKFNLNEIMRPKPISPLGVGIVATAAFLLYSFVWQASAAILGSIFIVAIVLGGSAIAIAMIGKNFKVL